MTTPDQRSVPVLSLVLLGAALIGFGIGTWLGNFDAGGTPDAAQSGPSPSTATTAAPPTPEVTVSPTPATPNSALPSGPVAILDIHGTGNVVSDSFDALRGWQIQWETSGKRLRIDLLGARDPEIIADYKGPASGVTSRADSGSFRLRVTAEGPWLIKVLQGEGPAPTASPS